MMQKLSWEAPLWKLTFLISSRNDIQVEHFLFTEISRWYQAKVIHTDFQMHCRCFINKYVEACVWWMAKLVAGTGLHVRLHTWRGGSSRVKRDTTLRLTLPRASHAAFHVIWLSHSTRGDPSFPGWNWDQGCFHPWLNNLPRPIQLGNRNFTALLGFIVPNVEVNYFLEIKHQYFGQDKLAHWLQWISDDWCRCWDPVWSNLILIISSEWMQTGRKG